MNRNITIVPNPRAEDRALSSGEAGPVLTPIVISNVYFASTVTYTVKKGKTGAGFWSRQSWELKPEFANSNKKKHPNPIGLISETILFYAGGILVSHRIVAIALIAIAALLATPAISQLSPQLARGTPSIPMCTNTTTQSWSPASGVVVTITASACVVTLAGHSYGVHSITSRSNSSAIIPRSATWDFFGEKYACGYSCDSKDIYSYPGSTGTGQFPNLNQTIGPYKTLVCAITQFNLSVLYQPTGQIYNLAAESLYRNPYCF